MDKQEVSSQKCNEESQINNIIDKQTQYQDNQQNCEQQNELIRNLQAEESEKSLFPSIRKKQTIQHNQKQAKLRNKQLEPLPFQKQSKAQLINDLRKAKHEQKLNMQKKKEEEAQIQIQQKESKQQIIEISKINQQKQQQQCKQQKSKLNQGQKQKLKDINSVSNNQITEIKRSQSLQKKQMQKELQHVLCFDPSSKSETIFLEDTDNRSACQGSPYYENCKLILTEPIKSLSAKCKFRVENIKYCIGFGVALKEVVMKHKYTYESEGSNQLSHGLYIVTSQGYSWSHSEKEEDDIMRAGFNQMYNGLQVDVNIIGEEICFKWKKGQFKLTLPARIREKYTLCFCAYLHQKSDAVSIVQ